jgi:hypothetical protein
MSFLADRELRALNIPEGHGLRTIGLALGNGANALEVAVTEGSVTPTATLLRTVWKARLAGRATPLLLVVLYDGKAALCGPSGDHPHALVGLDPGKVERICRAALEEPDRHSALRFLHSAIPEVETPLSGIRNEGLFATHELQSGVPKRADWAEAALKGQDCLRLRGQSLIQRLGFTLEPLHGPSYLLRAAETRVALAVFLERNESPEMPNTRFSNLSAISYALAKADAENLNYVVVSTGSAIRLYPVRAGVGVGRRGRTDTFVEVHLDLISNEQAGYLWLLFSSDALRRGGTVEEILEESARYAVSLGTRLRDRVYADVVPRLAGAILEARNLKSPSAEKLAETYQMALVLLFRLLFVAYAEDKELLPYKTNDLYKARSLKQKARELIEILNSKTPFGHDTTHWEEVDRLFRAVDKGNPEWGVPAYNGGLFSRDAAVCAAGAALAAIAVPDRAFGPVLQLLLVDNAPEGWGPVDFRSLGVREFGTIYQGLLENELSIAEVDLAIEEVKEQEQYRPAKPREEVVVPKGRPYLHNTSGARKATGSYFTKHFAVEHLLEYALEPALKDHLARLDKMDDRAAADAFFDLRVADIAMGSGHFLTAAVDHIERAFSGYLAKRRLPDVFEELARLRQAAREALGPQAEEIDPIEDTQLLRRQIARRCIYGVDLNPIAVELARLSLWVHTFVPGLPLSFLDHSLVAGNSLVGIATIQEGSDWLREIVGTLYAVSEERLLGSAKVALDRLAQLSDASAAEIERARQAFREAREATTPAEALFDVLAAARISEEVHGEVFQNASHWMEAPESVVGSTARRLALESLNAIPPFHFPVAFPEVFLRERSGFDVIVGNPPWEEATVEEDRFWTRYNPGFHSLTQKDQEIAKRRLRGDRPDLVSEYEKEVKKAELLREVLTSGPFPGMGTGDPDVYKAFCWRFWNLVNRESGRIGVVLPRSAWAAKGSQDFRIAVLENGREEDLTQLLNNKGWVFEDLHPQYTITLTSLNTAARRDDETLPLRGPYPSEERYDKGKVKEPLRFAVRDVLSWTDTAALPLLPTEQSGDVFLQLRRSPRLDLNEAGEWRVRPYAELHATNDKKLMRFADDRPEGYWPVFKGESFDIWEPDTGTYYAWADPEKVMKAVQKKRMNSAKLARSAFSEFPANWIKNPDTLPCLRPRIAFRDVTRATDSRTVRAALLPPKVFITNKGPYFLWPRGDEKDEAYLLGILCSLSLDWYSRRFVEISMNYHILNAFPVPRPNRNNPLWQRVVALAGRLASPDNRFKQWARAVGVECGHLEDDEKEDMIHELDAVVARLYGLSGNQLRHIFETFHEGWDHTKRLEETLKHFRAWQAGGCSA